MTQTHLVRDMLLGLDPATRGPHRADRHLRRQDPGLAALPHRRPGPVRQGDRAGPARRHHRPGRPQRQGRPHRAAAGLALLAFPEREDPSDVFVGRLRGPDELGAGRVIGTSSLRRRSQLLGALSRSGDGGHPRQRRDPHPQDRGRGVGRHHPGGGRPSPAGPASGRRVRLPSGGHGQRRRTGVAGPGRPRGRRGGRSAPRRPRPRGLPERRSWPSGPDAPPGGGLPGAHRGPGAARGRAPATGRLRRQRRWHQACAHGA